MNLHAYQVLHVHVSSGSPKSSSYTMGLHCAKDRTKSLQKWRLLMEKTRDVTIMSTVTVVLVSRQKRIRLAV